MVGAERLWLLEDDTDDTDAGSVEIRPASPTEAARALAADLEEVLW